MDSVVYKTSSSQHHSSSGVCTSVLVCIIVILVLVVLALSVVMAKQRKAFAPYIAIGHAFRAGGVQNMAVEARKFLPTLQRDLAAFTAVPTPKSS